MSTQHTPGPWGHAESTYGDEIWLGGEGAGMIVVNGWVNGGCMDDPVQWAKLQAEARLIRTAPALLAALEALVNSFEKHRPKALWDAARAAIAEAKGAA
jgi:hypothetical protein